MANSADTPADAGACARCAQRFGSCCTLTPGQEEFCFPLSPAERAAMTAAGAGGEHFAAEANSAGFVDNLRRLFPGEDAAVRRLFPATAVHDRLAVTPAGDCRLLGVAGCTLPREARPLYCRLYPFWVRAGQLMYFEFDHCLALQESRGARSLLRCLDVTESHVRHLYRDLRKAWGLP